MSHHFDPFVLFTYFSFLNVVVFSSDVLVSAVARLPRGPLLKRGSTITIICNATATATGPVQVQVQWLRRPIPEPVITRNSGGAPLDAELVAQPTLIATLMYNGVANIYVNDSEISIDRLSAVSYRLRIHMSTVENQGMYGCRAEVWGKDPHGGWYDTGAKAESNEVTVYLYARGKSLVVLRTFSQLFANIWSLFAPALTSERLSSGTKILGV